MSTETKFSNDGAPANGTSSNDSTDAAASNAPSSAPPELSLPKLSDVEEEESGTTHRTVSATLVLVGLLLVGAVLTGIFVEIDLTVDAPGALEPQTVWPVRAQEAGTVASVPAASGDTVQSGDVLARLDSMDLVFERAQLRADLAAQRLALRRAEAADALTSEKHSYAVQEARAALVRARANLRDRLAAHGRRPDVDSMLSSYSPGEHVGLDRAVSDVETARAKLMTARAETGRSRVQRLDRQARRAKIRRLKAELREVQARLDRLTLSAPTRGVILTDQLERLRGRYVQPGDLLMEVASLDGWRAKVYVNEQNIYHVQPGDPVKLEVRAFRDDTRELIRGTVAAVASEPAKKAGPAANGAERYRVTVRLNPDQIRRLGRERLRQGYSVEAKIITRSGRILALAWDYLMGA